MDTTIVLRRRTISAKMFVVRWDLWFLISVLFRFLSISWWIVFLFVFLSFFGINEIEILIPIWWELIVMHYIMVGIEKTIWLISRLFCFVWNIFFSWKHFLFLFCYNLTLFVLGFDSLCAISVPVQGSLHWFLTVSGLVICSPGRFTSSQGLIKSQMLTTRTRFQNLHPLLHPRPLTHLRSLPPRPEAHLLLETPLAITSQTLPNHPPLPPRQRLHANPLRPPRLEPPRLSSTRLRRRALQQRGRHAHHPLERAPPLRDPVRNSRIQLHLHRFA